MSKDNDAKVSNIDFSGDSTTDFSLFRNEEEKKRRRETNQWLPDLKKVREMTPELFSSQEVEVPEETYTRTDGSSAKTKNYLKSLSLKELDAKILENKYSRAMLNGRLKELESFRKSKAFDNDESKSYEEEKEMKELKLELSMKDAFINTQELEIKELEREIREWKEKYAKMEYCLKMVAARMKVYSFSETIKKASNFVKEVEDFVGKFE